MNCQVSADGKQSAIQVYSPIIQYNDLFSHKTVPDVFGGRI